MVSKSKPIVFSGVQPSGELHLGNYLGALRQWAQLDDSITSLFCIVDLHALTSNSAESPVGVGVRSREVAALYLSCGISPKRSVIFRQSAVPAHSQLMWYLMCSTPVGSLNRMTQYKSKIAAGEAVDAGILTYPVLMASDILLYGTNLVPVGDDQKQHVELTRDLAIRFNSRFGDTFSLPEAQMPRAGARVMALDDPTEKMSKSFGATRPNHSIGLLDSPDLVVKKVSRSITDGGAAVQAENLSPGVRNLVEISAALCDSKFGEHIDQLIGLSYGALKKRVSDEINTALEPIQKTYHELMSDPDELDQLLAMGAEIAREKAKPTLTAVEGALGLS